MSRRLVQHRSPCPHCCQDCRGLHSSFENYRELEFRHAGIDATQVLVPGGGARVVEFINPYGGTITGPYDRIFPVLTPPDAGTAAEAIDRRGLAFWVADREYIRKYLREGGNSRTGGVGSCSECFKVWPWGYTPLTPAEATGAPGDVHDATGGDVPFGFLPECFTEADLPEPGDDHVFGPNGGSFFDHRLRQWVENDWLLVVFNGDVEIDPPDGPDPSGGAADYYGSSPIAPNQSFAPIFKKAGQWYARTFRIETAVDKLVFSNPRTLAKDVSEDTAAYDRCLWIDEESRATFTWPGGIRPLERDDYEDSDSSGVEHSPWDEYAGTWRKEWLFGGYWTGIRYPFEVEYFWNHGFPDGDGDQFNHFDSLYPDDEVSVIVPYRTMNPNWPDFVEQIKYGLGGFKITPIVTGEGATSASVKRCLVHDDSPITCSIYADAPDPGPEITHQFKLRRVREEDLETRQDLFLSFTASGIITRSQGYEAWIGESETGRIVILSANGAYSLPSPGEPLVIGGAVFDHPHGVELPLGGPNQAPWYQYNLRWYKPGDGSPSVPVLITGGLDSSPSFTGTESLGRSGVTQTTGCSAFTVRRDVLGSKYDFISGAESKDVLVGALLEQLGGDPLDPPDVMPDTLVYLTAAGDANDQLVGVENSLIHTGVRSVKFLVDSADYWVNFNQSAYPCDYPSLAYGPGGRIRGLTAGTHTIEIPLEAGYYVRWWICNENCTDLPRKSIDNPLTFEIGPGNAQNPTNLLFEISDEEFDEPDPPEEPPGGLVCEWPTTGSDPCEYYGFAMAGPPLFVEPFEAVETEPEASA